ncbi:MAG: hypothetical protein Q7S51_00525 [Gallionellaceae bacterium]|nr:hypothetical protein [Gallionellaceae bacterium]
MGFVKRIVIGTLIGLWITASVAAEVAKTQVKGFDEQVQDIKKNILGIASELNQLEEQLLFPSSTQLAVFVALAPGDNLRLDALTIKIDGKDATHYIYSAKELEALQHGGIQRLYTGNIETGEHTLDLDLIGKSSSNKDYQYSASYKFVKGIKGAKLIEITLSGSGSKIESLTD